MIPQRKITKLVPVIFPDDSCVQLFQPLKSLNVLICSKSYLRGCIHALPLRISINNYEV